jgi:hypothetical protein
MAREKTRDIEVAAAAISLSRPKPLNIFKKFERRAYEAADYKRLDKIARHG